MAKKRRRGPTNRTHPTVPWLLWCNGCERYRDNSNDPEDRMFGPYLDHECLVCTRKKERITQGLCTPENSKVGASRSSYRRRVDVQVKRENALAEYKAKLVRNLRANGVKEWQMYELVKPRVAAKRMELGFPD